MSEIDSFGLKRPEGETQCAIIFYKNMLKLLLFLMTFSSATQRFNTSSTTKFGLGLTLCEEKRPRPRRQNLSWEKGRKEGWKRMSWR
jgi:hypothetical protein